MKKPTQVAIDTAKFLDEFNDFFCSQINGVNVGFDNATRLFAAFKAEQSAKRLEERLADIEAQLTDLDDTLEAARRKG